MKVTIEYDLSSDDQYEEEKRLNLQLKAEEMAIALWDVSIQFRNELKYNEDLTENEYILLEKLQKEFLDNISDRNLSFVFEL